MLVSADQLNFIPIERFKCPFTKFKCMGNVYFTVVVLNISLRDVFNILE